MGLGSKLLGLGGSVFPRLVSFSRWIPGGDIDGRCALIFILFYILNGVFVVERGIGGCNVWSFGLYVVWLCLCFVYM